MLKAMRLDALARFEDADFPQMRVLGRDAAEIVPIAGDDTRDLDRRSRNGRMPPAVSVLSRLRVRRWSGGMADDNRRLEHCICGDANKQEDRDHDRRNEVFHGSFLLKTRRRNPARSPARSHARVPAKTRPSAE